MPSSKGSLAVVLVFQLLRPLGVSFWFPPPLPTRNLPKTQTSTHSPTTPGGTREPPVLNPIRVRGHQLPCRTPVSPHITTTTTPRNNRHLSLPRVPRDRVRMTFPARRESHPAQKGPHPPRPLSPLRCVPLSSPSSHLNRSLWNQSSRGSQTMVLSPRPVLVEG